MFHLERAGGQCFTNISCFNYVKVGFCCFFVCFFFVLLFICYCLNYNHLLGKEGYVFGSVGLFVCLSVDNINQKVMNGLR